MTKGSRCDAQEDYRTSTPVPVPDTQSAKHDRAFSGDLRTHVSKLRSRGDVHCERVVLLMPDPLDELAEAWEHKTPGPWRSGVVTVTKRTGTVLQHVSWGGDDNSICEVLDDSTCNETDAHFIALCGTHVGTLLDRLRAAEAVCEEMWLPLRAFTADRLTTLLATWRQLKSLRPQEQSND